MPISSGPLTRTRSYGLRLQTDGEGGGSTLWPPIDDGSTPFAGTPVGVRFPFSRLYPRMLRSPLVQTVELTAGSPIFFGGPASRLRPRFMRGPSNTETAGPATNITGSGVLTGQVAQLFAAGQQDIFDLGNDTAYLNGQSATMSATSINEVVGVGVLTADSFTLLGQGSIFSGTDIAGTALLIAQAATMASDGAQDVIGQAVLVAPSATMAASGVGTTSAYGPEQVWQVLIEQNVQALELLRIIAAAVAGPSQGANTNNVKYESPITPGKVRIDAVSTDGLNRSNVTIDGSD